MRQVQFRQFFRRGVWGSGVAIGLVQSLLLSHVAFAQPALDQNAPDLDNLYQHSASQSTFPQTPAWTTILAGESAEGLTFTEAGTLLYQGQVLLSQIPVSYGSDGTITYAKRLIVSAASPTNRFSIVKACESATSESGLCWALYLVDRQSGSAQRLEVAKYGGRDWVQWSADPRYAIMAEQMEASTWFIAIDLQTGQSRQFDPIPAIVDLASFTWTGDRSFEVDVPCDRSPCPQFRGEIETLFVQ